MDLQAAHRKRNKLAKGLVAQVLRAVLPLVGHVLTAEVFAALVRTVFPFLASTRQEFRNLAREVYEAERGAALPGADPIPMPALREFTRERLEQALQKNLPEIGEYVTEHHATTLSHALEQQARDGDRDQLVAYVHADHEAVGWARIDPQPPTCSFCTMLISRGPVYKTAKTAGKRNAYHRGCTCVAVPIWDAEAEWAGKDTYREANELYTAARGDQAKFRQLVEERNNQSSR